MARTAKHRRPGSARPPAATGRSTASGSGKAPLWTAQDTRTALRLPFTLAMAVLLPENRRHDLLRRLVAIKVARRPLSVRLAERLLVPVFTVRRTIGDRTRFLTDLLFENELARLAVFLRYRRRAPEPDIRVEGGEAVAAALAAGRGAILWVAPMAHASLVAKMAWHRRGWMVSHLSRYSHGSSSSRLGARLLNPFVCRVEDRYLAERVRMRRDEPAAVAVRVLRRRLRENRLVSITALPGQGENARPPFLGGRIRLSLGPPRLAAGVNAALLPVFCWREDTDRFVVRIDPPLSLDAGPETATEAFARAFGALLERFPTQIAWPTAVGLFGEADEVP